MKTRPFLFWLLTIFASASLHASGFRIYLQDAAAAEQGNAFTATADNPSAIYYNPAGITQLTGHNLRSGLDLVYYNYDFRSNTGQKWDTIDHVRGVAQFFYTYSPEKPPSPSFSSKPHAVPGTTCPTPGRQPNTNSSLALTYRC